MLAGFGEAIGADSVLDLRDSGFREIFNSRIRKLQAQPGPAVVVNILGGQDRGSGRLASMGLEEFEGLLDDQVASTWQSLSALLPALKGRGGVVINIVPVVSGALCFAESLSIMGRCAAIEGGDSSAPVRVHTITVTARVPPAEVASAVMFLCSDHASYMSGNVLRLGGTT